MPVPSMPPGCTELTRTPYSPNSFDATLVNPRTAHFDEPYDPNPGSPFMPAIDDTLTIAPPPRRRIGAITFLMPSHVPTTLMRSVDSNTDSGSSSIGQVPL